jgi:UTP--glucose-1-phosphate uridylyltransferase
MDIKKVIIPIAGLGTRFLPLSKVVPKEFWPLVDVPMIQHIIKEALNSGIQEVIFIVKSENKKIIADYLKPSTKLNKVLKERKKDSVLEELKNFEDIFKNISFNYVLQKDSLGDGHAILQALKLGGEEPIACLFSDDIVYSKTPCILQLKNVFKTCEKPVIALHRLPKEKLSSYGVVAVEKIANRFYKIKKIIEKPSLEKIPSDFAIVGKYILTPEVFDYLGKEKKKKPQEIILANALNQMLTEGKAIYGYEFEGEWLECGTKLNWLKSNLYLSLNHPYYGPDLKKYLKQLKVL